MFKLTKTQEIELRKFIADTGNKYGMITYAKPISGNIIGFSIMNPITDFVLDVALDDSLFVDCNMVLEDTKNLDELKDSIERIVFETAGYEYLMNYLDNNEAHITVYTNEYGRAVGFGVSSPHDVVYNFHLSFDNVSDKISIDDNEDIISYEISGSNMTKVKKLIKSSIDELIAEDKIYSKYN